MIGKLIEKLGTKIPRMVGILGMFVGVLLSNHWALAQTPQKTTLQLLQSATGEITNVQQEQRWTFDAGKGQRISARMQATSGDLDPYLELLDSAGKLLSAGVTASLRNVAIDGFPIPDTATYTLKATRAQSGGTPSSGQYSLTLLPGFSFLLLNDPTGVTASMRTFRDVNSYSRFVDGKLELQLTAENAYTFSTAAASAGFFKDLYLQADLQTKPASAYWEAGLLVRGVRRLNNLQFYIYFVNSDAKWKVSLGEPGSLKDLTDWQPLPMPAQALATLGAMIKDNRLTLFYEGQPLGEVTDDTLTDAGTFGVAIGTGKAPNNNTIAQFTNFIVTLPVQEASNVPVSVPEKLVYWQRAQETILDELRQARLVPTMGKTGLEIKSKAFVTNNTAGGIVTQPLAASMNFTDLVYSADVTWESSNEHIACAMEIRAADDNNFTIVYFDRQGGYGVRQVMEKEGTPVAIYNLSDAIRKNNKDTNRVTIIAMGNSLIVYINGTLIANVNVKQTTGGVRIAAYNYERATSLCQFTGLWLRSFDR